jgi:elongator complex protein 3
MKQRGTVCQCIRCREIRKGKIDDKELVLDNLVYQAGWAEEHFLSYNTQDDHIVGFLRLSLPEKEHFFPVEELRDAAIIREVHVYGQSIEVGGEGGGSAQHRGLGSNLIEKAAEIARSRGYRKLTVISAVGTREYYAARGFELGELYMVRELR